jgi:hypothetical protein
MIEEELTQRRKGAKNAEGKRDWVRVYYRAKKENQVPNLPYCL